MSGLRSFKNPTNPAQGTAFFELVVAPTFMPDLARPFHVPGSDLVIDPAVEGGSPVVNTSTQSDATSSHAADLNEHPEQLIYVHVTLDWTERQQKSARANARPKKQHESKLVSSTVDVLSTSRVAFIPITLSAHNYENMYVAGVAGGPAMRISWSGSPGGKAGAAVVLHDEDWSILVQKLGTALKASKKLDTICVAFDLDGMEGFKQRGPKRTPDLYETELSYGSRVPNTDNCTPAQIALGAAMDDIKAAHFCAEHGTCFINGDCQHVEINRFRLSSWGQAVLSGQCVAGSSPLKELLAAWTGSTSASTTKPRGRTGPYPAPQPATTSAADLLLTTMVPVMAMMAQNMASNIPARAPIVPPSARSPVQASSPPPAIEDDLDIFMDAFRRAKNIPQTLIDNAKEHLRDARYTPDIICEASVVTERLSELTGLAEGEVHQLRKFARQWSGKMEGKRARRGIEF
ncbi:hypothetical protein C8R44DRAFT_894560 [Mycena epipterygia]|nr:hypothetical protein C8R44DRAFT_894560 [Mycena epipterygia]